MSPAPNTMVFTNKTLLRLAPDLRDARKKVPHIAPRPIALFRYPNVEALPLKISLA